MNLHWGVEYVAYPSPSQQQQARKLIDCGADVIIGHHPHVVQGIERHGDGVIFYSLGNFNLFTHVDLGWPNTDWGMVILIRLFKPNSVQYDVVPARINSDGQPTIMLDHERLQVHSHLRAISAPLHPRIGTTFWLRRASLPYFRSNLNGFRTRIRRFGLEHFLQMIKWLVHPRTYPFYLGLILRIFGRDQV